MWFSRDWIFVNITKGQFEHRDTLLLLWSGIFLLMGVRDQMLYLPAACGRYRIMAALTLATAVFSLVTCYVCMRIFGVVGALIGVLSGEAFNILGFVLLSLREIAIAKRDGHAPEYAQ
jgi:O-antigen/teichoic acid export membrane protein